jgi:hypothetical protein
MKEEEAATKPYLSSSSLFWFHYVSSYRLILLQYFVLWNFSAVCCLSQSGEILNSER